MATRVMRSLTAALTVAVLWIGASAEWPASLSARSVSTSACGSPLQELERRWRGTGEWKRLAPYPVPREASPTDSVGVWLEQWHMPNGTTELRRVSATLTMMELKGMVKQVGGMQYVLAR